MHLSFRPLISWDKNLILTCFTHLVSRHWLSLHCGLCLSLPVLFSATLPTPLDSPRGPWKKLNWTDWLQTSPPCSTLFWQPPTLIHSSLFLSKPLPFTATSSAAQIIQTHSCGFIKVILFSSLSKILFCDACIPAITCCSKSLGSSFWNLKIMLFLLLWKLI